MWILPVPWGQIPTSSLRKHGIKPALRLCTQSACRFSAILPRNPLPDMQSACGISEQSAKKSDDASYAQALFGVPLEPVLHLYKHRCKTGSFYFGISLPWKGRGTSEAGGGILVKFFLELQISQQNLSVSLRLPAQFGCLFQGSLIYKVGGMPTSPR